MRPLQHYPDNVLLENLVLAHRLPDVQCPEAQESLAGQIESLRKELQARGFELTQDSTPTTIAN